MLIVLAAFFIIRIFSDNESMKELRLLWKIPEIRDGMHC